MISIVLPHRHHAPQGLLSRAPEIRLLLCVPGELEGLAARGLGQLLDHADLLLHAGGGARELEEERGLDGPFPVRHAGLVEAVHLVVVEDLDGGDGDAGADDAGDAVCGLADGPEAADRDGFGGGLGRDFQGGFGDQAEGSLAADEQLRQVVPGAALPRSLPRLDNSPVSEHHCEAQHPLPHRPVAVCVRAAAPRADHATDHGSWSGIRWEEQVILLQLRIQDLPSHSRLYYHIHILLVELKDLIHLREVDTDASSCGGVMAFQARASAVPCNWNPSAVADLHDGAHLLGALGVYDQERPLAFFGNVR